MKEKNLISSHPSPEADRGRLPAVFQRLRGEVLDRSGWNRRKRREEGQRIEEAAKVLNKRAKFLAKEAFAASRIKMEEEYYSTRRTLAIPGNKRFLTCQESFLGRDTFFSFYDLESVDPRILTRLDSEPLSGELASTLRHDSKRNLIIIDEKETSFIGFRFTPGSFFENSQIYLGNIITIEQEFTTPCGQLATLEISYCHDPRDSLLLPGEHFYSLWLVYPNERKGRIKTLNLSREEIIQGGRPVERNLFDDPRVNIKTYIEGGRVVFKLMETEPDSGEPVAIVTAFPLVAKGLPKAVLKEMGSFLDEVEAAIKGDTAALPSGPKRSDLLLPL